MTEPRIPTGGALTTVNDVLAPRLGHILGEIKTTNDLLAQLLRQTPPPGPGALESIVARLPISLADLVYAIYATGASGAVEFSPQRMALAVNAGLTGTITYNNPNPAKVITSLEPLRVLSSMYNKLLTVTLTIDGIPHMANHPLNFDIGLEYAKYMVFSRDVVLAINNGSANNAVVTLDMMLGLVDSTLYEDTWMGIMQGSYDALKRIAPER